VGQGEVLEEDLHEFLAGEREDEIVVALAAVAGLAAALALARATPGRPGDPVALETSRRGSVMSSLRSRSRMPRPLTAFLTASRICPR
jgi:hypothetical protein